MHAGGSPRGVIIGSGLAGLVSALELAADGWRVEVVSAGWAGHDGATHRVHALAPWILLTAPLHRGDAPQRYLADLKARGRGLERAGLAEVLAAEAHGAVGELIDSLDLVTMDPGPVSLPGDELPRGLRCRPRHRRSLLAPLLIRCTQAGVRFRQRTLAVGVRVSEGRVTGLAALARDSGGREEVTADAVVLACGGSGGVFPVATGPRWCRGSGLALASAAGALLHRPELMQALPVTATPPLLFFPGTAALLGGTIATEDVTLRSGPDLTSVTLEIAKALRRGASVFLEPGEHGARLLPERIRNSASFRKTGRLPLTVASHHGIGGVAIDGWGRTSLPGLYACGEAAGGVQGEQRTMGTGLLEAFIFARRAARAAARDFRKLGPAPAAGEVRAPAVPDEPAAFEVALDGLLGPLVAWRPAEAVAAAAEQVDAWPDAGSAVVTDKGVLAAVRRRAALEILRAGERPAAREVSAGRDVAV